MKLRRKAHDSTKHGDHATSGLRSAGPIGRVWVSRLRPLAVITLVFLGWWAIGPWNYVRAMELERLHKGTRPAGQGETISVGPAAELAESLDSADRLLAKIEKRPVARPGTEQDPGHEAGEGEAPPRVSSAAALSADHLGAFRTLREQIADRGERVLKELEATGRHLVEHSLPEQVQARYRQKRAEVERGLSTLRSALDGVESSAAGELPTRLAELRAEIDEATGPSLHNPLDPKNLPFRPAEPRERSPRDEVLSASGAAVTAEAAAAIPPTPADLAETPEVQLTPGITALAESLDSNPLAIYNWVRENIRFVPTFGSIQGAEACRLSEECNAFDTASLLIALLRASDVPARYVRGTVEVEPALFRSAMGDFTRTRAAARLASSGGIPTVLVSDGDGDVVGVRMEHIWVEAFVDYSPGRGALADSQQALPGCRWTPPSSPRASRLPWISPPRWGPTWTAWPPICWPPPPWATTAARPRGSPSPWPPAASRPSRRTSPI